MSQWPCNAFLCSWHWHGSYILLLLMVMVPFFKPAEDAHVYATHKPPLSAGFCYDHAGTFHHHHTLVYSHVYECL